MGLAVYLFTLLAVTGLAAFAHAPTARSLKNRGPAKLTYQSAFCVFLAGLILFWVSALRYNVGTDYGNYRHFLARQVWPDWEVGFVLLAKSIRLFTENYPIFIAVNSLLFTVIMVKCLWDYETFHPLTVYLFFCMGVYFQSFCMLRQILAIALLFYGWRFLKKGDLLRLSLTMLAALLFHSSVLIVAPAFLLAPLRFAKRQYLWGFFWGILLTPGVYLLGVRFIDQKYVGTFTGQVDLILPLYSLMLGAGLFVLTGLFKDVLVQQAKENVTLCNLAFFYLIYALWFAFVPAMSRCFQYFIPYFTLLIPRLISCQRDESHRRFLGTATVLFYFVFFLGFAVFSDAGVLPYQTVFTAREGN